ncbi:MAG: hypothetical protein ACXVED_06305 [Bacteroidia bacterium]
MEKTPFYNRWFSSFMPTYDKVNGEIIRTAKPYNPIQKIAFEKNFDAQTYNAIRSTLYKTIETDPNSKYKVAFFPLFPILWKVLGVSGFSLAIINFLLFSLAIFILFYVFIPKGSLTLFLFIFALPTLTVFIMPYTEALFMLFVCISTLGWYKEKYFFFYSGLFFACLTRPIFVILIFCFIALELFFYLKNRTFDKGGIKISFVAIATISMATASVGLFQKLFHNDSFFSFILAQKHWGTFLQTPKSFYDWSFEGFGMNVFSLCFAFFGGGAILLYTLFNKNITLDRKKDFWVLFSWIYLILSSVFVLAMQGGCLHSLYRYTLCSPFFFIILFHFYEKKQFKIQNSIKLFLIIVFSSLTIFFLCPFSANWDFCRVGYYLLIASLFYFIFERYLNNKIKYVILCVFILCGLVWNTYLLDMFNNCAWIFL